MSTVKGDKKKSTRKKKPAPKKKTTKKKSAPVGSNKKISSKPTITEINNDLDLEKFLEDFPEQHRIFADEYLTHLNATRAYRDAGYKARGNSAEVNAHKTLRNTKVQMYLQYRKKQRALRTEIDQDYVVSKLKRYSEAKITDFFTIMGGSIRLKDLDDLPDDAVSSISEIRETINGISIKLVDKRASLVDLGKHIGMWEKNDDQVLGSGKNIVIVKEYVVPQFKNINTSPKTSKGDMKQLIQEYLKERKGL